MHENVENDVVRVQTRDLHAFMQTLYHSATAVSCSSYYLINGSCSVVLPDLSMKILEQYAHCIRTAQKNIHSIRVLRENI